MGEALEESLDKGFSDEGGARTNDNDVTKNMVVLVSGDVSDNVDQGKKLVSVIVSSVIVTST